MLLRTWTTTLFLASALLFACGGDDDGNGDGDGDGDSPAVDGGGGGGDDGGGGGDDAGVGDSDAAPDFEGIQCGDDTCDETAQVCCAGGEGGLNCAAECDTVSFGCDGPEDCPDGEDVCCGSLEGTACSPPGECGGGGGGAVVCHAAEDCPEQGDECCMRPAAMVGVCRPNCPGA